MGEMKENGFGELPDILDGEDEETLAAIDRGIESADESRLISSEEVRQQLQAWLSKAAS